MEPRGWPPEQIALRKAVLARLRHGFGRDIVRATGATITHVYRFKSGIAPFPPSKLPALRAFLDQETPSDPQVPLRVRAAASIAARLTTWKDVARSIGVNASTMSRFAHGATLAPESAEALEVHLRALGTPPSAKALALQAVVDAVLDATPARVDELAREVTTSLASDGSKLDLVERAMLARALAATRGNKAEAARLLGIDRKCFERRWRKVSALFAHARPSRK